MNDKLIRKSIKALAKAECCNYVKGYCALTDKPCHLINPNYPTIHDGCIDCDYFMESVLPPDWELNDLVWYAIWADDDTDENKQLPDGMRLCEICQQPFIYSHARQKYCKSCAVTVNKDKSRQRKNLRLRAQRESAFLSTSGRKV